MRGKGKRGVSPERVRLGKCGGTVGCLACPSQIDVLRRFNGHGVRNRTVSICGITVRGVREVKDICSPTGTLRRLFGAQR